MGTIQGEISLVQREVRKILRAGLRAAFGALETFDLWYAEIFDPVLDENGESL